VEVILTDAPVKKTKRKSPELPPEAYDRIPRAQLTLTDETLWLSRFDERGNPCATYPVSVADAARAFRNLGQASSGILPPDVLFWQAGSGGPRLGLWLAPGQRVITWGHGKRGLRLGVPLPGLVFVGKGRQYWVWAAMERPADGKAPLYAAPLPNVNPDGLICSGSVQFPACAPATLAAAAALFFESRFNGDLSMNRVRNDGGSLLKFLRGLVRARQFPAAQLRPAGLTMGQVLNEQTEPVRRGAGEIVAGIDYEPEDEVEDDEFADVWLGDGEENREELEAQQAELME